MFLEKLIQAEVMRRVAMKPSPEQTEEILRRFAKKYDLLTKAQAIEDTELWEGLMAGATTAATQPKRRRKGQAKDKVQPGKPEVLTNKPVAGGLL